VTTTEPVSAARAVAAETAQAFADAFAERLTAAYLLGSLTYGGYAPAVSDIDVAAVLTDRRTGDPDTVAEIVEALRERTPLHRKLSVFWSSLPALRAGRDDGRFPAIDRVQLADHGRLLIGSDVAGQVARASGRDVLLESARFAVGVLATDEVVTEFHHPRRLLADPVWFTKAVLFPVRFLRTATEHSERSATNDEAIAWYLGRPDPAGAALVRLAARVRAGAPLDPAEAASELAAGLLPLYRGYLDDHLARLRPAGAPPDLVAAFVRWGERLNS
jgi:hypothetical protein